MPTTRSPSFIVPTLAGFFRAKDLQSRLWLTLFVLIIMRLGEKIPLPMVADHAHTRYFPIPL
ncbi:MAG: hypothetical protein AAFO75_12475 [Pseudomonadota bacterium]